MEVTLQNGMKRLLKAGDAVAEVVNTLHNGKNVGDMPVKLAVFYAGAVGAPTTIKTIAGDTEKKSRSSK
jgi:quercetin dioxygenase-like cupin family protein